MPQIDVSFDIDANGIIHVTAKDLGTGNEQQIRIEGGSGLSEDDVERMVKDAEAHADEAHRLRELADAKNLAETLAYQTEKSLAEHRDKLDASGRGHDRGADHGAPAGARRNDLAEIREKATPSSRRRSRSPRPCTRRRRPAHGGDNGGTPREPPRTRSSRTPTTRSSTRTRRRSGRDRQGATEPVAEEAAEPPV